MPRIFLDDYQAEVLRGYVGELLADTWTIPSGDRLILDDVYAQLSLEDN